MRADERQGPPEPAGQFSYDGLDRVLHEKARLGIMTSLATHPDGLLFNELRDLCALTDGNLSRHLQTLQEAGLVEIWKGFHRRRPQTLCRISAQGLVKFQAYLDELEKVVRDAAAVRAVSARSVGRKSMKGWAPA